MYDYEANRSKLHSASGQKLTSGLFEELARYDVATAPIFKMADWRKTYVEIADPTDYEAALALIGDWEHWVALRECAAFMKELLKWREEVAAKLQSEGVKALKKQAKLPTGIAAAKWLAESGKGRKKKEPQPDEQAEKQGKVRVGDDAKRLGLHAVK